MWVSKKKIKSLEESIASLNVAVDKQLQSLHLDYDKIMEQMRKETAETKPTKNEQILKEWLGVEDV